MTSWTKSKTAVVAGVAAVIALSAFFVINYYKEADAYRQMYLSEFHLRSASSSQELPSVYVECSSDSAGANDMDICTERKFEKLDKQLNDSLSAVTAGSKINGVEIPDGLKEGLAAAQKNWVLFRDSECDAEGALYEGGSGQSSIITACKYQLTKERIAEFAGFLNENFYY